MTAIVLTAAPPATLMTIVTVARAAVGAFDAEGERRGGALQDLDVGLRDGDEGQLAAREAPPDAGVRAAGASAACR